MVWVLTEKKMKQKNNNRDLIEAPQKWIKYKYGIWSLEQMCLGFFHSFFNQQLTSLRMKKNLFECDVQYFILYKVTSEMDD